MHGHVGSVFKFCGTVYADTLMERVDSMEWAVPPLARCRWSTTDPGFSISSCIGIRIAVALQAYRQARRGVSD